MINYNEAVKQGVEAYIAKKGMDENFIREEIVPLLKEIVKEKAIIGDIDLQFIIYSEAILVLEGNYESLDTKMVHEEELDDDEFEEEPRMFVA